VTLKDHNDIILLDGILLFDTMEHQISIFLMIREKLKRKVREKSEKWRHVATLYISDNKD
jgi:hypothetical protein